MVTLTGHACKHKVHTLHQRSILKEDAPQWNRYPTFLAQLADRGRDTLQALVYVSLPPTIVLIDYAIGLDKLSAKEQCFFIFLFFYWGSNGMVDRATGETEKEAKRRDRERDRERDTHTHTYTETETDRDRERETETQRETERENSKS